MTISALCYLVLNGGIWAQVAEVWSVSYQKFPAGLVEPMDMVIDNSGNIYLACKSPTSLMAYTQDYCLIKYSPSGQQLWLKTYNGPKQTEDFRRIWPWTGKVIFM